MFLSVLPGGKVLFTKGAESAILPFATGGEMEKTRLHVDEFALVRHTFSSESWHCLEYYCLVQQLVFLYDGTPPSDSGDYPLYLQRTSRHSYPS